MEHSIDTISFLEIFDSVELPSEVVQYLEVVVDIQWYSKIGVHLREIY